MRTVLIGGCSRSGTTLLGTLLGAGPCAVAVPESQFLTRLPMDATSGLVDVLETVRYLERDWRFGLWNVDPKGALDGLARRARFHDVHAALVRAYGAQVDKEEATIAIDHTPSNLGRSVTLARLLPNARFVHIVRDGRAVAASVMPLDWGPNDILEAARHWAAQIATGLAAAEALGPYRVTSVRFEDLVRDPRSTLEDLCRRLGMPSVTDFVGERDFVVPAYTLRQHQLVERPPDPSRIDAWRNRLSPRQIETFEFETGELLDLLGYGSDHGIAARPIGKVDHLRTAAASTCRRLVINRVRRARRRRSQR